MDRLSTSIEIPIIKTVSLICKLRTPQIYPINILYCFLTFGGSLSIIENTISFSNVMKERVPHCPPYREPRQLKRGRLEMGEYGSGAARLSGSSGRDGSARSSGGRCQPPNEVPEFRNKEKWYHGHLARLL